MDQNLASGLLAGSTGHEVMDLLQSAESKANEAKFISRLRVLNLSHSGCDVIRPVWLQKLVLSLDQIRSYLVTKSLHISDTHGSVWVESQWIDVSVQQQATCA